VLTGPVLSVIHWRAYPSVDVGPISLSPHGVGIAVGYALGGTLMARRAARWGISRDDVWNMLMRAVVGVIIGARLFYVAGHLNQYWPNVIDIVKVWQGGVVFYGGVFGGILFAYPYMRKHNLAFWSVMDAAAPGFPLGLFFGRIGDLIVGDHLGGASTLPFAFVFKAPYRVAHPNPVSECFTTGCHQTALYDWWNVIVLLPIVLLIDRKPRAPGFLIMFTATWYGSARFFVDFARTGTATYLGLRGTQWISLVLFLVGSAYLIRLARRGGAPPAEPPLTEGPGDEAAEPSASDA
jgi:phosphatidylglycerol---prolipoprotein diacylglyceryl transferase